MRILFFLLFFTPIACLSQEKAMLSSFRLKPLKEKYNVDSVTIIYPIVKLHNKIAFQKINRTLRETLLPEVNNNDSSLTLDSLIKLYASDGLISMSYKALFNENGILSLKIFIETVAAYPNSWQESLNFNLETGNLITMKDIIKPEKYKTFTQLIYQDKIKALKRHQSQLKNALFKKEIDKATYEWAFRENNSCIDSVSFEKFNLTKSTLQIFDRCDFPHMIQAIGPAYNLSYKLSSIKSFIREEVLRKLIN